MKKKPVTRKPGRPVSPETLQYIADFKTLRVGQSFFVPDKTLSELAFFRRAIARGGMKLSMRSTKHDAIHEKPGVRIWREA